MIFRDVITVIVDELDRLGIEYKKIQNEVSLEKIIKSYALDD